MAECAGLASDVALEAVEKKNATVAGAVFSWRKCVISGCLVGQAVELNLLSLLSGPCFTVVCLMELHGSP